jgi:protein-disulfide isomerase
MKYALSILALLLLIAGTTYAADKRVAVPIGDSPSMGPENAPVTIVEFIDFQ